MVTVDIAKLLYIYKDVVLRKIGEPSIDNKFVPVETVARFYGSEDLYSCKAEVNGRTMKYCKAMKEINWCVSASMMDMGMCNDVDTLAYSENYHKEKLWHYYVAPNGDDEYIMFIEKVKSVSSAFNSSRGITEVIDGVLYEYTKHCTFAYCMPEDAHKAEQGSVRYVILSEDIIKTEDGFKMVENWRTSTVDPLHIVTDAELAPFMHIIETYMNPKRDAKAKTIKGLLRKILPDYKLQKLASYAKYAKRGGAGNHVFDIVEICLGRNFAVALMNSEEKK